jgi:CopG family nickel-responsive transcriptional regulator
MRNLARFSVSVEKELLAAFDAFVSRQGYPTRSEAVAHLMTKALVEKEWQGKGRVAGAILMVYDHHKRDVVRKLLNVQHDYAEIIVSSQHVHLDHDNCLEMVTVKGRAPRIRELLAALHSLKGMKHSSFLMTTAGGHPS